MSLAPHQQRVVDEKAELDSKLTKLTSFYDTSVYYSLPYLERDRLIRQGKVMSEYSEILGQRIAAFTEGSP